MGPDRGDYDRRKYWEEVGQNIRDRKHGKELAGEDTPFYYLKRRKVLSLLRRALEPVSARGGRILEVGSGPGGNVSFLRNTYPGATVVGVDASKNMIDVAMSKNASLRGQTVCADGVALPYRTAAFDVCMTVTVLQHVDDAALRQILLEMARVSASQILLLEDIAPFKFRDRASHFLRPIKSYEEPLRDCRLRLVERRRLNIFWSELWANLIRHAYNLGARSRRTQAEGLERPAMVNRIERAGLVLCRVLDRVVLFPLGIQMLRFERIIG